MKKYFIFFCFFISFVFADLAEWTKDPYTYCSDGDFCVVASDESNEKASKKAEKKIINFFEKKIEKEFKNSGKIDFSIIKENIKYQKKDDDKKTYYVLAKFEVDDVAKQIIKKIDKIDDEIEKMLEQKKDITNSLKERKRLNKLYFSLKNNVVADKITSQQINQQFSFHLTYTTDFEEEIAKYLKKLIVDNGAFVVENEDFATNLLNISIVNTTLYTKNNKISQFWVFKFLMIRNNKKIGGIYKDMNISGENESSVKQDAEIEIKRYLKEHINEIFR
ncbi:MAG: hypothetical protein LBT02_02135 [Rickettsiales bacterium]|jgi:hypothetical protein|nr:hypothetical protein [Rickettsiales bacterium]